MTTAHRDLASPEPWTRSLQRSRRRRELLPKARRENNRRKHMSAALAAAMVGGPTGSSVAFAQVTGDVSAAVASESPANRAIEVREGGLPLQLGSQGELVAHVQKALQVSEDGIFGPETDAAVREYQTEAGIQVDGIVGPVTWSALFESSNATATGAAIGGSNVPTEVKQQIEQTLEQAGQNVAAQDQGTTGTTGQTQTGQTGTPPTSPGGQVDSTQPATPVPTGQGCGSGTVTSPVSGTQTSGFGPRGGRNHDGVDIAAPTGTPVRAAACGSVSVAGQQSGYGNIVCITHTSEFSTCYAHLSRFAVSQGAQVQQGQVIGYVGCTGSCTGPHVHFETRVNGQAQDPRTYLAGASAPGRASTAKATAIGSGTEAESEWLEEQLSSDQQAAAGTAAATPTAAAPETVEQSAATGAYAAPAETYQAPDEAYTAPAEAAPAEEAYTAPAETYTAPAETAPAETYVAPAETAPAETVPAETYVAPAETAPAETYTAPAETYTAPAEPAPVETYHAPAETYTTPAETAAVPAETAVDTSTVSAETSVTTTAESGGMAADAAAAPVE
jgi:murein DD-endopeptidase MepM/ murein hydrolase activator NlpD